MYKEVISNIEGVSIYPVFSVIVFFVFFSVITVWVMKSKKEDFDSISKMPLNENEQPLSL